MNTNIQAQLCDLTINGLWNGTSRDRKVEAQVELENHSPQVGTYRKRLFPEKTCGADNPHTCWVKACNNLRTFWRSYTAPWEDGRRILSVHFTDNFSKGIEPLIEEANAGMAKFCEWLPTGIELAREGLNGLFNPGDYASASQIQSKWKVTWAILPIPQSSHLIGQIISPAIEAAKKKLDEANVEKIKESERLIWMEVLGPVMHMADTLSQPGSPKFWDSLVGNVIEVADRIPALNFTGSDALSEAQAKLKKLTESLDPDMLRVDPLLRQTKSDEAKAIVESFGKFTRKFD